LEIWHAFFVDFGREWKLHKNAIHAKGTAIVFGKVVATDGRSLPGIPEWPVIDDRRAGPDKLR
jgi:hypothetical protein